MFVVFTCLYGYKKHVKTTNIITKVCLLHKSVNMVLLRLNGQEPFLIIKLTLKG